MPVAKTFYKLVRRKRNGNFRVSWHRWHADARKTMAADMRDGYDDFEITKFTRPRLIENFIRFMNEHARRDDDDEEDDLERYWRERMRHS